MGDEILLLGKPTLPNTWTSAVRLTPDAFEILTADNGHGCALLDDNNENIELWEWKEDHKWVKNPIPSLFTLGLKMRHIFSGDHE